MSQTESSKVAQALSFLGIIGTLLMFAAILYFVWLPSRPPAVDHQRAEERRQAASEAIAAGKTKISETRVIDEKSGVVSIPVEQAMQLTVADYQVAE